MNDSRKLLEDYVKRGSEEAFRELVRRYVDLVHSTAIRLVNGDSHLAEDVTQTVFVNLARKAATLHGEAMIGGWLHRNACFVASTMMRGGRRRQNRERQAVEMNSTEDHSAANLASVAPALDDAINQLGLEDRAAIVLRFFELLEFRAVGEAMGTSEDAARKRVCRALEKLHSALTQHGVAFSAAALGTALAAGVISAAPIGMAVSAATAALAATPASGATLTLIKLMSLTKIKIAVATAVLAVAVAAPVVVQHQTINELRRDNEALRQQVAKIATLQEQMARLSESATNASLGTPLRDGQIRELARLRNEVSHLRGQSNELAQARQQIEQMRQSAPLAASGSSLSTSPSAAQLTQAEREELRVSRMNTCINNLRLIDASKQQWALEFQKQSTEVPAMKDLQPYLGRGPNGELPVCPDGGVYTTGSVGERPTCSVSGHALP